MNWTYIAAFSAAWLAGYQYARAVQSRGFQPSGEPGLTVFHACGLLSGILLVVLLVGGFIRGGLWWQPVVIVAIAWGVTFASGRILPTRLMPAWISLSTLAAVSLSVAWAFPL